jgi:hypothetical protein
MGAWSEDTFGNDTACDWIDLFLRNPGWRYVQKTIDAVLSSDKYLDSDAACNCLAASEVLARLQGRWGIRNSYSEDLDRWVEANPMAVSDSLKIAADSAMAKILGPNSELAELWDEGGRNQKWHEAVNDLRKRVKGDTTTPDLS